MSRIHVKKQTGGLRAAPPPASQPNDTELHVKMTRQVLAEADKKIMDYVKSKSIAFLEWTAKNGWVEYDTYDRWTCPSEGKEVIDTEELYKRFKNKPA